jgi:hypothetical protein
MAEQPEVWRVVVIAVVLPIAQPVIEPVRAMGHDVVAWLNARLSQDRDKPPLPWGETTDKSAPQASTWSGPAARTTSLDSCAGSSRTWRSASAFRGRSRRRHSSCPHGIVNQHRRAAALPWPDPDVLGAARGRRRVLHHLENPEGTL